MRSLRFLVLAFACFLAAELRAFRARPVSDLRFEGFGSQATVDVRFASDGSGFLALTAAGSFGQRRVFTQKIVDGKPAGPRTQIGEGETAGLAWTGSEYLAGWQDREGLWVARVSREGSRLTTPTARVVNGRASHLAINGSAAIAIGYTESNLTVQPLTLAGTPSGPPLAYVAPVVRQGHFVGPAANGGFAMVFTSYSGTWVMLFRADGTLLRPAILLDGPYAGTSSGARSLGAAIGTDGTDTLILYGVGRHDGDAELKSAVLAADGTVESNRVIRTLEDGSNGLQPIDMVWDGSQFLAALSIDRVDGPDEQDMDAALLRVTRGGEPSGDIAWIAQGEAWQRPLGMASNGRELLAQIGLQAVTIDAVTLQPAQPFLLGRTLAAQHELTIEAGPGGYLAAWFEVDGERTTLRASRIDAAGNYLDGEGIVLGDAAMIGPFYGHRIAIDGRGPNWMVVWSNGQRVAYARSITRTGEAVGAGPLYLDGGDEIDVWWDGTHYILLRVSESLFRDVLAADGTLLETTMLVEYEEGISWSVLYAEPTITMAGGRLVGVFARIRTDCYIGTPGGCYDTISIHGVPLDRPGAEPFVITPDGEWGYLDAASDGNRALVVWSGYYGTFGSFLDSPKAAGPKFTIGKSSNEPELAYDGTDFLIAHGTKLTRVTRTGGVTERAQLQLDAEERLDRVDIASSTALPPLIGYVHQLAAYDGILRGGLLFEHELENHPPAPSAPVVTCSTIDAGTVSVRWQPVTAALGISIEVQLTDGTFRPIGVAAANDTSTRISTAGLTATGVRVRAWNESGLSAPSALAPAGTPPAATLRDAVRACAGTTVTLSYSLTGIAPFTVRWSDGLVQTNLGATASRTVSASRDLTLRILSVADQSCAANETPRSIRILVDPRPEIANQPREVTVPRGRPATLTIDARDAVAFEWFEGLPGNTTRPVGTNSPSFTTPALQQTTRYWVRVSNRCGSVSSEPIMVTTSGKGRAVRK